MAKGIWVSVDMVWIKLKPGCESTNEGEIKKFAGQHIAAFKIPRYIRFVDAFPVSATGKIQRFKMSQKMVAELDLKKVI